MASSSLRDEPVSMGQVIEEQERLREEAAEAIPFTFSSCTWGSTEEFDRQPIYSCLSCRPSASSSSSSFTNDVETRAGICAGCSVACHSDCELVELFTRRDFVCDCGSTRLSKRGCNLTLRKNEKPNEGNRYDKNFDGVFCSCGIRYDPVTEEDEMVQCLMCEDWYHAEKCLSTPGHTINPSSFEHLVCEACVDGKGKNTVRRYAGTPCFMLLKDDGTFLGVEDDIRKPSDLKTTRAQEDASPPTNDQEENGNVKESEEREGKRSRSPSETVKEDGEPAAKRIKPSKLEDNTCTAPPLENVALRDVGLSKKNVYLAEGWRDRWCRCDKCMPLHDSLPYLLHEETVYEPPVDPDSAKSLEELGTDALSKLPHEQAVQGLEAYTSMRDKLKMFLEPFAKEGKVVSKQDVDRFFEEQKQNGKL